MKTINYLFTFLFFLIFNNAFSQDTLLVYKTFEEYSNNSGTRYNKYYGWSHNNGKMKIWFKENNKKIKIPANEIWGVYFNGAIFRTDTRTHQFARLLSKGKICYYENGAAHLNMIGRKTELGQFPIGYYAYVSKDLESEMIPFPSPQATSSDAYKLLNKFKTDNKQYDKLFEPIGKDYYYYKDLRIKIKDFEEM